MYKYLVMMLMTLALSGCVTVKEPQEQFVRISGVVTFKEATLLPANSSILVAVIDADSPGVVLEQREYQVAKLPVPFFFTVPEEMVDNKANYVVWAAVRVQDKILLRTQKSYPVINNGVFNTTVLVEPVR
ncbi:YbaY family lipoprotein [Ferrimonas gelatinilytica]|uniref:YbaY family lipoprotein n=1 Tax=Ferrimonas gelatinilytica TaxID=1255257 RepID=A0ABP9SAK9_9GAMM